MHIKMRNDFKVETFICTVSGESIFHGCAENNRFCSLFLAPQLKKKKKSLIHCEHNSFKKCESAAQDCTGRVIGGGSLRKLCI